MNILVVGGAGYLGGAVTDILKGSRHSVRVYDVLMYEETYRKDVPFVHGDVRDQESLKKQLEWADAIIWLAALVGDPVCALNPALTRAINAESVRFARAHFKGKFIFLSTCSVYGAHDDMLHEESKVNPLSLYAQTKYMAEKILSDTDALIFRLGTLYGISDAFSRIRFDLVLNTLVMRAVCHGKISVFGGGQYRPLLHVRDAAGAICDCIGAKAEGVYNLHSGNYRIVEIAEHIKKYFPSLQIDSADSLYQDNRNYRVSDARARNELRFEPKLSIDDGIEEIKKLLQEGRVKDSFLTRFSNYLYLRPLLSEYQSPLGKVIKFNI